MVLKTTETIRVSQQGRAVPKLSELDAQKLGTAASKNHKSQKEENG
jgi:hypothetical protein